MTETNPLPMTSFHWGTFRVETRNGRVHALHDFEGDPDPSPIGQGILDVLDGPTRIDAPMVRRGWLENGPGETSLRGSEEFVRVSWDEAEKLVAAELSRICETYGNAAIFGGSYGWASAGSFHLAQAQLYRFLNCIGGFTKSLNSYSFAAAELVMDHMLGGCREFIYPGTSWKSVIENTELLVAFGGIPLKNGQMGQGGCGRHRQRMAMEAAIDAGIDFVSISPIREDTRAGDAQWLAPRPNTDTAIILALAHTLLTENLHDQAFLDRYTVGFDRFAAYVSGETDGVAKTPEWASEICELDAETLRQLARRLAAHRTIISVSWSLTRQHHGEQPFWAAITLAAMLGQIGLPGGGIAFGYSALNSVGNDYTVLPSAAIPSGHNPVEDFIPVARISDMLLHPGEPFFYDGVERPYPDVKLLYWAGGNPFHHHQDINRLLRAWEKPQTIITHEWCWNALARHSDIVLPCTTGLEREDIAWTPRDGFLVHMQQAVEPFEQSRDDYEIFRGIARQMGVEAEFSQDRSSREWIDHLYAEKHSDLSKQGIETPTLEDLKKQQFFEVAPPKQPNVLFKAFRDDPQAFPLKTPSGRIELFSEVVAGYGQADCPGHAAWFEPSEWLGAGSKHPFHLVSNQPRDKLHGQLDHGAVSRLSKIDGREPIHINPDDAAQKGIADGAVVKVFNDRGACYCGAVLDAGMRPGVVRISTGAWFDPDSPTTPTACKRGNPNMLTPDRGTSSLAQGPTAHSCLVDIEPAEDAPAVSSYGHPPISAR